MARQPRFIEDDEPRRRGSHTPRYEREPADVAPTKEKVKPAERPAPVDDDTKRIEDDVEKILDEASAATEKDDTAPAEADHRRFEDDEDDAPAKSSGKKLAMMILAIVLCFAIVGAGVFALIHFVIMPQPDKDATAEIAVTEPPPIPEEPTLTPDPTQPPTEAPTEPDYSVLADTYMKDLSTRDKICQLFIVTPEVLTAGLDDSDSEGAVTLAGEMTKKSLAEYPVGGIIYFADNLVDQEQTKEMIANSQKYSSTPLFIAVDEEGGDVARVAEKLGTTKFKPMFEYKDKGEDTAHDNAEVIASNLRAIGFNMDNAPVADVLSNPDNTVIGDRAYSDDYSQAAALVKAAVQGFNDGGVINVLKHFPGHGDTEEDSHEGFAYVKATVEDLKKNELLPFKSGIEGGADMVMVGHLVVEDLDPDAPATLSSKVVPELLRKELGYNGIVITDSMSMGAITENYTDYETIVKGLFDADIDIILQPDDLDAYIDAIESLLESGDIKQEQIDAKVKKILTLKFSEGIIKSGADTSAAPQAAAETTPAATEAPASEAATDAPAPITPDLPEDEPTIAA